MVSQGLGWGPALMEERSEGQTAAVPGLGGDTLDPFLGPWSKAASRDVAGAWIGLGAAGPLATARPRRCLVTVRSLFDSGSLGALSPPFILLS